MAPGQFGLLRVHPFIAFHRVIAEQGSQCPQPTSSTQPPSSEVSMASSSYAYEVSPYPSTFDLEHLKFPNIHSTAVQASQQGWWDSFLRSYRMQDIATELNFLFTQSAISLSFINVRILTKTRWDLTVASERVPALIAKYIPSSSSSSSPSSLRLHNLKHLDFPAAASNRPPHAPHHRPLRQTTHPPRAHPLSFPRAPRGRGAPRAVAGGFELYDDGEEGWRGELGELKTQLLAEQNTAVDSAKFTNDNGGNANGGNAQNPAHLRGGARRPRRRHRHRVCAREGVGGVCELGHSLGEYAGLVLAGMLSLTDVMTLAVATCRAMFDAELQPRMAPPRNALPQLLHRRRPLAGAHCRRHRPRNSGLQRASPSQTVFAGPRPVLEALLAHVHHHRTPRTSPRMLRAPSPRPPLPSSPRPCSSTSAATWFRSAPPSMRGIWARRCRAQCAGTRRGPAFRDRGCVDRLEPQGDTDLPAAVFAPPSPSPAPAPRMFLPMLNSAVDTSKTVTSSLELVPIVQTCTTGGNFDPYFLESSLAASRTTFYRFISLLCAAKYPEDPCKYPSFGAPSSSSKPTQALPRPLPSSSSSRSIPHGQVSHGTETAQVQFTVLESRHAKNFKIQEVPNEQVA
ncbi:hypothetical protein B0H16DRAFT_1462855 [Mycena metata]|uniref:Uncharacterized protein n=1 Tax=Mycena metata TaxID=1033252 RepID=A0AAD7IL58_9AGAR|nr:hypothetical protein B0H16DRAFT_1462855 [Mycena metata]